LFSNGEALELSDVGGVELRCLALDASGKALVAWTARAYDEGMPPSMLRVAAFDGKFWTAPQTLSTGMETHRWNPRLSASADGDVRIEWETLGHPGGDGRLVRTFSTTGSPKTDETRLFFTLSDPPAESPEDPDGEPIWE